MNMKNVKQLIVSSSPLFKNYNSKLIGTEVLYGESVNVIEIKNDLVFCKLLKDEYEGWLHNNVLGNLRKPSHKVSVNRTFIYKSPDIKSEIITYLSFGSMFYSKKYNNNWYEIFLEEDNFYEAGFVMASQMIDINCFASDWVSSAEMLIGTPYKWGGKNTLGIDCSALIQLSLESSGYIIPRDTKLQREINTNVKNSKKNLERGMLIFWDGHVGAMVNPKKILHSNAFYMSTVVEELVAVSKRANNKGKDITHILDTKDLRLSNAKLY